jgi:hypothetical protein
MKKVDMEERKMNEKDLDTQHTQGLGSGDDSAGKTGIGPVAWVPTWEIPVLLKGADWAVKGGERLTEWLTSEGPLAVQVLNSRADASLYHVDLRATNLTVHAIYLGKFDLKAPPRGALNIAIRRFKFGLDEPDGTTSKVPKNAAPLIRPGQSLEFSIEFPKPTPKDLQSGLFGNEKRLGTATLHYQILNEESSRNRDVNFSVRIDD